MTTKVATIREVIEPHIPISVVGPSDVGRMIEVNALVTALEAREEQIRKEAAASAETVIRYIDESTGPTGGWMVSPKELSYRIESAVAKLREGREERGAMSELERATMETLAERRAALQRQFNELAVMLMQLCEEDDSTSDAIPRQISRGMTARNGLALWERLK